MNFQGGFLNKDGKMANRNTKIKKRPADENPEVRLQALKSKARAAIRAGERIDKKLSMLKAIQKEFPFDSWAFEQNAWLALKNQKNYAEAAQVSELGLKTNPGNTKLNRLLAEALSHLKGEESRAERLFHEALAKIKGMEKIKLQSTYADFLIRRGDVQKAQDIYRSILKENPDDSKAQIDLARAFRIDKKYEDCLKCLLEKPRVGDPYWLRESGHCLIESDNTKNVSETLLKAREIAEKKLPRYKLSVYMRRLIPLEKALRAMKGEWREAVSWALQQKHSALIRTVFISVRRWLVSNNEIEAGILYLTEILKKDRENLVIPYQIDKLATSAGFSQEKLQELYENLLEIAPKNMNVLVHIARLCQESETQLAEQYWEAVWQVARQMPERMFFANNISWAAVSHCQFLRKLDRYEDAYMIIEEARTHWGVENWELDLERAICLFRLGSYAEAYEILVELDRIRQDNPVVMDQMGACLRTFGEFEKATDVFKRKTVLYPEDIFGWQGLGSTYFDSGRHDEALQVFTKILETNPGDVEAKWIAAQIYQQKGEYEKAKSLLKDIDPLALIQRGRSQGSIESKIAELERQRLEHLAELEEARKLSYLGVMATATAHELNQPIGIIRASSDAALKDIEEGYFKEEDIEPLLQRIFSQTTRLSAIIDNFRRFARGDRTHREKVLLSDLVERTTVNFLEQFKHRNINLTTKLWLKRPTPVAWANFYQLEEVLINLITNARDAVEGRKNATVWVKTWRHRGGRTGLSVEDNGPGLSQEYRRNMFVPFFSTKPTEKGTGLGLYISRRIVDGLGGQLRYKDRNDGGAIFIVNLPPLKG